MEEVRLVEKLTVPSLAPVDQYELENQNDNDDSSSGSNHSK